jgi:hypothetical protein
MSSIAEIMSLVSALSLNEKLQLNAQLATAMSPSDGKTSNPKAKSSRAGKPASLGTRAWGAFVKHVQETMSERFAPPALPKERLVIAGAIRLENPAAYEAFCAKFKEAEAASDSEAAPEAEAAAPEAAAPAPPAPAAAAPAPEAEAAAPAPEAASASESESAPEKASAKPRKPRAKMTDEQKAIMKAKAAATKAKKAAEATA